jgi:hypothetical protein
MINARHIAKTRSLGHGGQPDRCYPVTAAIIACDLRAAGAIAVIFDSRSRVSDPSSSVFSYGDGNVFLPDSFHDHADTVGPSAKLRSENDFGVGRRLSYPLSLPHRNVPVGLWRSDNRVLSSLYRYQRGAPFYVPPWIHMGDNAVAIQVVEPSGL